MDRTEFIRKVFRIIMFAMLAVIAAMLGKRTVTGSNCSTCSGRGICNGNTDCEKYLTVAK